MLDPRHLLLLEALQNEFANSDDWVAVGYVQRLIGYIADEHGISSKATDSPSCDLTMH